MNAILFLFCLGAAPANANSVLLTRPLSLLKDLVSISSGTADVNGVNEVQKRVAEEFKQIGFNVQLLDNPEKKPTGKMLVAEKKGEDPHFITLVTHADTVFEKLNPFHIDQDGKTIHGSGVSDNKGGIVVGLMALSELANTKMHHSLRFVVSPAEEIGSPGFAKVLKQYGEDSVFLVGLEPALDNGNYVSSRKGVRWYNVRVTGKESHAGAHHEDGVNACQDLAIKIAKMQALTNYQQGTTVSIGHIEGGKDKYNIVCGSAEARIDTRFSTPESAAQLFRKIDAILQQSYVESASTREKTKTEVETSVDTAPLPESRKARELLKQYISIIRKIEGRTIRGEATGGVADLNQMVGPDSVVVDGMGPIGANVHTADEKVDVNSINTRIHALTEFLVWVDQKLSTR